MVEEDVRCKCAICAEVFDRTTMTALHCGHVFHEECMQGWLEHTDTPTCPNCGVSINKDLIVRRLFFEVNDDQNNDVLMVALRETEFALSRAEAELQELKNDKKEVEDKLALELGKVASFGIQIHNQNRQLDEATNLQKELIGELCGERGELKILREKEIDFVLRIRDLEDQQRISKKNEDDSKLLVKNLEEQLRISKKNENDSKLLVKNLEEQLRISKKNEDDSKLLVKNLEEKLRISKKNENDSKLLIKDSNPYIENLEEQLRISKKNEDDSKLLVKNLEEQLRISKENVHLIGSVGRNKKVDNLEAENNDLKRQLDEARNLQKKLTKELNAEREQLRILKEKSAEEQLRTSKKMEDLEALVKVVKEWLKVLDERDALKMFTEVYYTACTKLRSVEEQLKNMKTKETDSGTR
ncbi:unnamed protein product [Cylicocyclus nassatus]|uniref:RING-type domain-containing protein n=1 Tax=Cylicocyclus nassatus TaxID=53992 RepID=A0AA36GQF9_CYLNA|nr:unnamed protein product [Cylicocyclus nassatus]